MKNTVFLLAGMLAAWAPIDNVRAATPATGPAHVATSPRLLEADRKLVAGRVLLKWGSYVEKTAGQDRRAWAAALWPSLATADLDNLQKALQAVTYEGMRNALLGQRPYDDQIIDRAARVPAKAGGAVSKALGALAEDLVFTPITPCRIVDTRNIGGRIVAGATRDLDASNAGGSFSLQGGDAGDCAIPANPAALALSVTGLGNTSTGYLRVFPYNGTSAQGSPVPLNAINTTVTNDMIVPTSQGTTQELKVFSTANTHYAAFVTGYFMAPVATPLECTRVNGSGTLAASSSGSVISPVCPVGYSTTGAACRTDSTAAKLLSFETAANVRCQYLNEGTQVVNITAYATCCRVPGR